MIEKNLTNKKLIIQQFHFCNSNFGLKLANKIIENKILNQINLLKYYLSYEKKELLINIINQISNLYRNKQEKILKKNELFLLEAKAAKLYWRGFGLLIKERAIFNGRWKESPATKLLNIGYHFLSKKIERVVIENNLWPEIGIYHSFDNNKPLVYDLMELYRQPLVDKTALSFIRNKKTNLLEINPKLIKLFVSKLKVIYEKKFKIEIEGMIKGFIEKIKES